MRDSFKQFHRNKWRKMHGLIIKCTAHLFLEMWWPKINTMWEAVGANFWCPPSWGARQKSKKKILKFVSKTSKHWQTKVQISKISNVRATNLHRLPRLEETKILFFVRENFILTRQKRETRKVLKREQKKKKDKEYKVRKARGGREEEEKKGGRWRRRRGGGEEERETTEVRKAEKNK